MSQALDPRPHPILEFSGYFSTMYSSLWAASKLKQKGFGWVWDLGFRVNSQVSVRASLQQKVFGFRGLGNNLRRPGCKRIQGAQ